MTSITLREINKHLYWIIDIYNRWELLIQLYGLCGGWSLWWCYIKLYDVILCLCFLVVSLKQTNTHIYISWHCSSIHTTKLTLHSSPLPVLSPTVVNLPSVGLHGSVYCALSNIKCSQNDKRKHRNTTVWATFNSFKGWRTPSLPDAALWHH